MQINRSGATQMASRTTAHRYRSSLTRAVGQRMMIGESGSFGSSVLAEGSGSAVSASVMGVFD
jgi:hypothetical protein